jgi:hypothetical protein
VTSKTPRKPLRASFDASAEFVLDRHFTYDSPGRKASNDQIDRRNAAPIRSNTLPDSDSDVAVVPTTPKLNPLAQSIGHSATRHRPSLTSLFTSSLSVVLGKTPRPTVPAPALALDLGDASSLEPAKLVKSASLTKLYPITGLSDTPQQGSSVRSSQPQVRLSSPPSPLLASMHSKPACSSPLRSRVRSASNSPTLVC